MAASNAREHGGKISSLGGVDAQGILPHGTTHEVKEDVCRIREILGPHGFISLSHGALLPDVLHENVEALAEAAHEYD